MQRVSSLFIYLFIGLYLIACAQQDDKDVASLLSEWDSVIDINPQAVSDSLKTLDYSHLSRDNKAYYNLLKVISDDKTYVNFKSDSLINAVVNYYKNHDSKSDNYIRSLAYQGIVRTRMGVNDSTVFEPLKEADRLFHLKKDVDPAIGYMIHYFLGKIHYNNSNPQLANEYFQNALTFSKQEKDSTHLFDCYAALYWIEIRKPDIEKAKLYLDSMSYFHGKLTNKDYFILNAQSVFYDVIGDKEKALEKEKEQIKITTLSEDPIDISRLYYVISDRYVNLRQLDSAMLYAQMSIDMIEDSTYRQNYLYYKNIAHIAEKQQNYTLANDYLKKSFDLYGSSISDRLDTQIMELEKRYDLTEAENDALKAQQNSLYILIAALTSIILLAILHMITRSKQRKEKNRLLMVEYKIQQQEAQAVIMKEEANKRKWLLQLYSHISDRLTHLYDEMGTLSQRLISSQPKTYKELEGLLKNTETDLRDITKVLAPDSETFFSYTHLRDDANIFTDTEKMLLMLLSCNATNRQLATFMNTTIESIRVRKSQLKKKMTENEINTELFFAS